jgi:hypothetical protein
MLVVVEVVQDLLLGGLGMETVVLVVRVVEVMEMYILKKVIHIRELHLLVPVLLELQILEAEVEVASSVMLVVLE